MKQKTESKMDRKRGIKESITSTMERSLKVLRIINNKSIEIKKGLTPHTKFFDLYSLLCQKNILIQAYGNIERNKGRLTAGVDQITSDGMKMNLIDTISQELKENTFMWKPVKRVWVEKHKLLKAGETKKMRPIGIPTLKDKIVQEGIRLILEAIYEPIFETHNFNFGFRPKKSSHQAIEYIKYNIPGCLIAIEGDIEGAYDNVQHYILIDILSRTISDHKFRHFLKKAFEAGILENNYYEHSLLGVPQGGIASPILFHIYMHEFDMFIKNEFTEQIEQEINLKEGREKVSKSNKLYNALTSRISRLRLELNKLKSSKKWVEFNTEEQEHLLSIRKKFKETINLRLKEPSVSKIQTKIRMVYTRYADDFVIFTNGNKKHANFIKEKWRGPFIKSLL
jgi:retron-type reverse transcriptase